MDDTRVWVTGASRGLGRAIADAFVEAGARVALSARSGADLAEVATSAPDRVIRSAGSVADADYVQRTGTAIADAWGGLDVLVNCAGISPTLTRSEFLDVTEWSDVLDVNLTGTFLCSQAAGRMMLRQGWGSIINISSVHSTSGMARLAAYSASKGAIDALTRTLAVEWADRGVRVNAIRPGYFETDMTQGLRDHAVLSERLLSRVPQGRFGQATADLVPMVMFLASDASGYVTGSCLTLDGGWTAQ